MRVMWLRSPILMSIVSGATLYRMSWYLRFCSSLSCLNLEVTGKCEGSVRGGEQWESRWFEMAWWREEYVFGLIGLGGGMLRCVEIIDIYLVRLVQTWSLKIMYI